MKKWVLIAALIALAGQARAQSLELYPLKSWTSSKGNAWVLGIDKSPTAGACLERELHDGQWLGGPCRDLLILSRNGHAAMHLGGAVLWNAEHGNANYALRTGFNIGPAMGAALDKIAANIPAVEGLANISLPPWANYISNIATVDGSIGYRPVHDKTVNGNLTYGAMFELNIPLADLESLIKIGL